jgi:hypothetical protein
MGIADRRLLSQRDQYDVSIHHSRRFAPIEQCSMQRSFHWERANYLGGDYFQSYNDAGEVTDQTKENVRLIIRSREHKHDLKLY